LEERKDVAHEGQMMQRSACITHLKDKLQHVALEEGLMAAEWKSLFILVSELEG
jgi:hypothetical protein